MKCSFVNAVEVYKKTNGCLNAIIFCDRVKKIPSILSYKYWDCSMRPLPLEGVEKIQSLEDAIESEQFNCELSQLMSYGSCREVMKIVLRLSKGESSWHTIHGTINFNNKEDSMLFPYFFENVSERYNLFKEQIKKGTLEPWLLGLCDETHSRKNNSGFEMEDTIKEIFISQELSFLNQVKSPQEIEDKWGICVDEFWIPLLNLKKNSSAKKRFDFVVKSGRGLVFVEANLYNTQGSVSEKMKSYPQMQEKIKESGHEFVYITHGMGWGKMMHPLEDILSTLDYTFNLTDLKEKNLSELLIERKGKKYYEARY